MEEGESQSRGSRTITKDRPQPTEYVRAPLPIMDTVPAETTITQTEREKLETFEATMRAFADMAREKGHPVGIDYFTSYKPKLLDKVIGTAGAVGLAMIVPLVVHYYKDMEYVNPKTGEQEKVLPVYIPQPGEGSEMWKIRTQDPRVVLTPEELEDIRINGKSANDRRIIGKIAKYLRKFSFDEIPQAAEVGWGWIHAFGIRSGKRMLERMEKAGLDKKYPRVHQIYKEAMDKDVKKGVFGGYGVVRGIKEEGQLLADTITLENMCEEAEPYILRETLSNIVSGRGAR